MQVHGNPDEPPKLSAMCRATQFGQNDIHVPAKAVFAAAMSQAKSHIGHVSNEKINYVCYLFSIVV